MSETAKVYTVWSGGSSRRVALVLREWLPIFLKGTVDCSLSGVETRNGRRRSAEFAEQLDTVDVGIICLVPDNVDEAWMHFEAGALAKSLQPGRIFCCCFDVQPDDLPEPLRQFQAIAFNRHDFLRFLRLVNGAYGSPLSEKDIEDTFDSVWNALSQEMGDVGGGVTTPDQASAASAASDLGPEPVLTDVVDLPVDQLRILLWFIENPSGTPTAPELARDLNIHPAAAQCHLSELFENEYIGNDTAVDGDPKWCLYQGGRDYLQFSGLLK